MKRFSLILTSVLLAAMLLVSCATAKEALAEEEKSTILDAAAKYVAAVYDKSTKANPVVRTASDYVVNDMVTVNGVLFPIEWSTDCADATVEPAENHIVNVLINKRAAAETEYTLRATITDPFTEKTAVVNIPHILPKGKTPDQTYEEIVFAGYQLADGEKMTDTTRLYGTVTSIASAWSDQYKNISIFMVVDGLEDYKIEAYRLAGEGAENLKVGDKITVEGQIKNYKGTIEFDSGCKLIGFGEFPYQKEVVEDIYKLAKGEKMSDPTVLTGKVTKIDSAWSDQYQNISVYFAPFGAEDKVVEAYRLSGNGAKDIKVGDTITVWGYVKRYNDIFEFDSGCKLIPNDCYNSMKNILHGYGLEAGQALEGARTVKGVVTSIPSAYSASYGNITVNLACGGVDALPIQAYRLTGGSDIKVGDTITVTGTIKNYNGTIEFDKGCTYTK